MSKKLLIIQPIEIVSWETFDKIVKNIEERKDAGVLVLNKNMTYEVVEVGETKIHTSN